MVGTQVSIVQRILGFSRDQGCLIRALRRRARVEEVAQKREVDYTMSVALTVMDFICNCR